MKKKILLVTFIFFYSSLFAETVFSLRPLVSFCNASQREFVYYIYTDDSGSKHSEKLSELDWNQDGLCLLGLEFNGRSSKFSWGASFKFAIPVIDGIMYDSDWSNVYELPNVSSDVAGLKTHYTESDCKTVSSFYQSFSFGYDFHPDNGAVVTAFIGLDYTFNSMTANGLRGKYGVKKSDGCYTAWDSEFSTVKNTSSDISVITLDRHWFVTWAGLGFEKCFGEKFTVGCSLALSPFTFLLSFDRHLLRSLDFMDCIFGALRIGNFKASVGLNLTRNVSLNFGLTFQAAITMEGLCFYSPSSASEYQLIGDNASGGDYRLFETWAGVKFFIR